MPNASDNLSSQEEGADAPGSQEPGASPFVPPVIFAPPVKRSVTIAGHQTAISLEPIFWDALRHAAAQANLPVNALIARIDVARMSAPYPPNLTSAIRSWLFAAPAQDHKSQDHE